MTQELIVTTTELASTTQIYLQKATDLKGQAERAVIDSTEKARRGSDFLKIVKSTTKNVDDERKALVEPYGKRTKVINAEFKKVTVILSQASEVASRKVLDFQIKEQERKEEERKQIEAQAQDDALTAAQEAEKAGNPAVADQILELAVDAEAAPAKPPAARGDLTGATTSVRKVWTARVDSIEHMCHAIAEGQLPTELIKEISQLELNKLARAWHEKNPGSVEIGQYGITAFEKASLQTR